VILITYITLDKNSLLKSKGSLSKFEVVTQQMEVDNVII